MKCFGNILQKGSADTLLPNKMIFKSAANSGRFKNATNYFVFLNELGNFKKRIISASKITIFSHSK